METLMWKNRYGGNESVAFLLNKLLMENFIVTVGQYPAILPVMAAPLNIELNFGREHPVAAGGANNPALQQATWHYGHSDGGK